jgi:hypothetical protein
MDYWNDGFRNQYSIIPTFHYSRGRTPSNSVADRVYTSLLPAMSENGLATDKGLKVMIDTLGTALGKNVDFSPDRLLDYTLLREVQKELGIQ